MLLPRSQQLMASATAWPEACPHSAAEFEELEQSIRLVTTGSCEGRLARDRLLQEGSACDSETDMVGMSIALFASKSRLGQKALHLAKLVRTTESPPSSTDQKHCRGCTIHTRRILLV